MLAQGAPGACYIPTVSSPDGEHSGGRRPPSGGARAAGSGGEHAAQLLKTILPYITHSFISDVLAEESHRAPLSHMKMPLTLAAKSYGGVLPKVGIETPHLRQTQTSAQLTHSIWESLSHWVPTIAPATEQPEPNKGAAEQHERPWLRDRCSIPLLPRL